MNPISPVDPRVIVTVEEHASHFRLAVQSDVHLPAPAWWQMPGEPAATLVRREHVAPQGEVREFNVPKVYWTGYSLFDVVEEYDSYFGIQRLRVDTFWVDTSPFPNDASRAVAALLAAGQNGNSHALEFLEGRIALWGDELAAAAEEVDGLRSDDPPGQASLDDSQESRIQRRSGLISCVGPALTGDWKSVWRLVKKFRLR